MTKSQVHPIAGVIRKSRTQFLNRGWYPTGTMTHGLLVELENLRDDNDAFDAVMIEFARNEFSSMADWLPQRWPDRAGILADAFAAHSECKFTLSIPVMLIQADGIGREALKMQSGSNFFSQGTAKKSIQTGVDIYNEPGTIAEIFDTFLDVGISPSAFSRTDNDTRSPVNRHQILHGRDTKYATEANGLRCAIQLRFLTDVADTIQVRRQRHQESKLQLQKIREFFRERGLETE